MLFVFGLLFLVYVLIPLFLLLVVMPIMGLMDGDIFVAVVGPAALTFWLSMKYLLSGHWLRFFRRNDDQ